MIKVLHFFSKRGTILVLLAIFLIFWGLFGHYSNNVGKPLDSRFDYNLSDVQQFFDALGPNGRGKYQWVVGRLDMIYPVFYGLFYFALAARFYTKYAMDCPKIMLLFLLPPLTMLFDYWENFNTLQLLREYPNIHEAFVSKASIITKIKIVLFVSSPALPLFGLLLFGCCRAEKGHKK
jgi:hypothetical protein